MSNSILHKMKIWYKGSDTKSLPLFFYKQLVFISKNESKHKNSVFIVTSLDRWIADKNGRIDSLYSIPNSDNIAMGYVEFNKGIEALIIGWIIFETVLEFDVDWPFNKAVFLVLIS